MTCSLRAHAGGECDPGASQGAGAERGGWREGCVKVNPPPPAMQHSLMQCRAGALHLASSTADPRTRPGPLSPCPLRPCCTVLPAVRAQALVHKATALHMRGMQLRLYSTASLAEPPNAPHAEHACHLPLLPSVLCTTAISRHEGAVCGSMWGRASLVLLPAASAAAAVAAVLTRGGAACSGLKGVSQMGGNLASRAERGLEVGRPAAPAAPP
jgi:hypothetical protein